MTAGCAARRLRARAVAAPRRRSSARASNAGAVGGQSRTARRGARGRTIWRKPKPLTAVRSNGCGRCASTASAAAWRCALPATVGRSMPIDPPMPCRRMAPRRRARAGHRQLGRRQASRRHRSGSSPGSATCAARRRRSATIPLRASRCRSSQPASAELGRAAPGMAIAAPLERGGPACARSTRASGRFHGSAPGIASRVTSIVQRPRPR